MKKIIFTVLLLAICGWAGAQQVRLLESGAAADKKAAADPSDMPQILVPLDDAPDAEVKKSSVTGAEQAVKPAVAALPGVPGKEAAMPAIKPAAQAKPAPAPVKAPAKLKPAALPEAKSDGGFAVNKKYTVLGGDTLWGLSGKYYGDPYKWGKIYNANLGTVANPDRIYPKDELIIPGITEEVKPEIKKEEEMHGADTVKEAGLSSSDIAQPAEAVKPGKQAADIMPSAAAAVMKEEAPGAAERNELSEDMPVHQKEWASGVEIVSDAWREDGVVKGKEKGDYDSLPDSLSTSGEIVYVSLSGAGPVRPGDCLAVYLKGSVVLDRAGKKAGRELQPAGTLEVLSVDGSAAKTRVIDAVTAISKGYLVKKK